MFVVQENVATHGSSFHGVVEVQLALELYHGSSCLPQHRPEEMFGGHPETGGDEFYYKIEEPGEERCLLSAAAALALIDII